MKCQSCGCEETKVIDSRPTDHGNATRRRRECEKCEFRFTTFERSQLSALMVKKKDKTLIPYDRKKLERSILVACGKRQIPFDKIREKLRDLEGEWSKKEGPTPSTQIGEDVLEMLKHIDEIAFIRFASVYKQFADIEAFKNALDRL